MYMDEDDAFGWMDGLLLLGRATGDSRLVGSNETRADVAKVLPLRWVQHEEDLMKCTMEQGVASHLASAKIE
jgi:hypothetical protein